MRKFPWKNWAEWETVYNGFFDYLDPELAPTAHDIVPPTAQRRGKMMEACKQVAIWQIRGHTPKVVEITRHIFHLWATRIDSPRAADLDPESLKYLISAHIIRAVNVVSDHYRISRTKSISTIAGEIRLPQLLVDLRHEATHKDMPSLEVLKAGLCELLRWLYTNYWQKQYAQTQRETANAARLVALLAGSSGETAESEQPRVHRRKSSLAENEDCVQELIAEVTPYCRELGLEGKCRVAKKLITEILHEVEMSSRVDGDNSWLADAVVGFAKKDEFDLGALRKKLHMRVKRSELFAAVIRSLEAAQGESAAKIIQGIALKKVIKHASQNMNEGYEDSIRYAIMYKYVTKHSGIFLKSLVKSSAGLRRRIQMIGKLRWVNLAAQSVYATISKRLQEIAAGEEHTEKLSESAVELYQQKGKEVRTGKAGTLLEETYAKAKGNGEDSTEAVPEEMRVEDLIAGRPVVILPIS